MADARCCDAAPEAIEAGWLVEVHNHCTIGCEPAYGHQPGCGMVPIVQLSTLPGWVDSDELRAEVAALTAEVEALNARADEEVDHADETHDAAVREAAALRAQLEQWQGIAEADRVRAITLADANAKLRDQLIDAREQPAGTCDAPAGPLRCLLERGHQGPHRCNGRTWER